MYATTISQQTERIDNVKTRMDSIERDVKSAREQTDTVLQQQDSKLTHMSTMVTSHGIRLDTVKENVDYIYIRMDTIERDVQSVKEQTDTLLQQQEKKHQRSMENMSASIAKHGVRLDTVEETVVKLHEEMGQMSRENNSHIKESTRKRRPESDGLRQLKNQTEDRLDTFRRLECIPTNQATEAKKLLERKRSIVIKGNPGEGKTTLALYLIENEMYQDRCVALNYPKQWKKVDTDWIDIVVLEDILGKFDIDHGLLQEWMVYLPTIQEHVDAGKLQVIITTRTDILSKGYSKIGSLRLFSDDLSLRLSSDQLQNSEKIRILNRELLLHKRKMKEDDVEKCITYFSGLIGFPQCCSIFAGDNKLFDKGPEFFRSPKEFFLANITMLENTGFLSLVFLFCNGKILEENLSPQTLPASCNCLLMELVSHLQISKKKASITLLRDAYDKFLNLYVVKSNYNFRISVKKPSIWFTHATVMEAVGHVLGDRCLELVVRYGNSQYLYQKTYTGESKDSTSENLFIPVSVYEFLAERMVLDVVHNGLVWSVVKHLAFRHPYFLIKLKDVLHKSNMIKDFFMATPHPLSEYWQNVSKGECLTFMQCTLQSDQDVVRLVYNQLLEFLTCTHNNKSSDCWQCEEKQKLLELALYYHHFQIADELTTMNASYTNVSVCNAARHGDPIRVQTIIGILKRRQNFNRGCMEAKDALCRAFISGNQNLIDLLSKESIKLDSRHVVDAVKHGDINVLMKVVEHLKHHNKWNPQREQYGRDGPPYSTALYIAYCNAKFEMADYLLKNEVNVSQYTLACVFKNGSHQVIARMIHSLKVIGVWDPKCDNAPNALEEAYSSKKYDVCDLLIEEGVSLSMKNLHVVHCASLESVKKIIQHLKDTNNWDPKCDHASEALKNAYIEQNHDVCDQLVQEGVSLTMKHLPDLVLKVSLESVQKALQHLKDTGIWDPKCDHASEALQNAYGTGECDVCNLLVQEGISLTMKNLNQVIMKSSLIFVKQAVKQLQDIGNWDPKCDDAASALITAYNIKKYDVYDLLIQEGVSLRIEQLLYVVCKGSLESLKKAVQHLKDTANWDPKSDGASEALVIAYKKHKHDVCVLLAQEGVSLTMKNLPGVVYKGSVESVTKAIQHLKDRNNWDPNCNYTSEALDNTLRYGQYDMWDLLVQEEALVSMKHLPDVANRLSFESFKTAVQHLKCTDSWNPKSYYASEALKHASIFRKIDLYDLLVHEGVSLTVQNLYQVMMSSADLVKTAVKQLKDVDSWDPTCDDASRSLQNAYSEQKYDVCALLIQEGVSLTMKNFLGITQYILVSLEAVKKAIQHLKDTDKWDPKCDDASEALATVYRKRLSGVCDQLILEGVSLTMKNLVGMVYGRCLISVQKAIQHLQDTENWDPKCDNASIALAKAYREELYDVVDQLIEEGISLSMKNLPLIVNGGSLASVQSAIQHLKDIDNWDPKCSHASEALLSAHCKWKYDDQEFHAKQKYDLTFNELLQEGVSLSMGHLHVVLTRSFDSIKKAIKHLKDTDNWDPKCNNASEALANVYILSKYDVCNLLVTEGVTLTMKYLPSVVSRVPLEQVKKAIQHLKSTGNWDPKCDYASKALEIVYVAEMYDVYDLLVTEGVTLTMKYLPSVVSRVPLEQVKKAIQHLKDADKWDPKCEDASKALEIAYSEEKYDVFDQLVQEGVVLTMKNLPSLVYSVSLESVKKVIQHLKDTDKWDPMCDDAAKALYDVFEEQMYDIWDCLVEEGVSLTTLTMNHLTSVVYSVSFESVKKSIQHLKNTDNWDPKCDDANEALKNAYSVQKYDVCDMLVEEGVSLTMKCFCWVVFRSLDCVTAAVKQLKDTDHWDPKCGDALEALKIAYCKQKYDVCDLLVQEGVPLTMKNLCQVVFRSLDCVKAAVKQLKDTGNWDPKCGDALEALEIAYSKQTFNVCDLFVQEGVSLTMKNLPGVVYGESLESVERAVQHLKDTDKWDSRVDDASKALANAYRKHMYDVCDLLIEERVSLTMENLPHVVYRGSLMSVQKAIQHLKDTGSWNPKCYGASEALAKAYWEQEYYVCELLIKGGVSLTMKTFLGVHVVQLGSLESFKKAIQHLKDTGNWNPKCYGASETLAKAYWEQEYDVCELLIEEGVSLTMKTFPGVVLKGSLESVRKAIQHLKYIDIWDPRCVDVSFALATAYIACKYDVCDLLVQEGASASVRVFPS